MTYDQFLAAICIWREARSASLPAMTAIWWVLNNRAKDQRGRWPRNIPAVITQPKQFSSFNAGDPNATKFPTPAHAPDWAAFQNCQIAVSAPLGADPTDGATNYHSVPADQPQPSWADPEKMTVQVGVFKFYRL